MIVNKYSILMLFIAALGLALAGVLAATALWAAWRIRRSRGEQEASGAERSMHLATLVAVVCLAILMIGWPCSMPCWTVSSRRFPAPCAFTG